MSITLLWSQEGNRSNCKANECCCPGRTGQWSYPGFRGKSNTKRRKLFSQAHLSGVDSVLCSPCLLSAGIELQVRQRTLNLLVSFLKMLTWKGHGLKAYQNNSCWFLSRAFYSRSYALGLCPNLFWSTGLWGRSVRGNQAGSWLSPSASAAWEEGLIQQADWKSLWDTKQMLPFIDSGGVSSSLCKSGQVECSPANGSCRAEISCLPFQKEKHTELYGARHSTFMSQHIDLENVKCRDVHGSLQLLPAFLGFQLRVLGILLLLGSPLWITQHPDTGRQQVPNQPWEATFWHVA